MQEAPQRCGAFSFAQQVRAFSRMGLGLNAPSALSCGEISNAGITKQMLCTAI